MRNHSRPMLHLRRTAVEMRLEALTALGLIALMAMTVWGYFALPAVIPTHYDLSGTPTAYGGKASLALLPLVSICLVVLMTILSRFPHLYNYPWPITSEQVRCNFVVLDQDTLPEALLDQLSDVGNRSGIDR